MLAQQQASPPPLDVTLAPEGSGAAERMDVIMRIPAPMLGAGKPLLRMPLLLAGTPTARYEASAIQATNAKANRPIIRRKRTRSGTFSSFRNGVMASVATISRMAQSPVKCVMVSSGLGPRSCCQNSHASHRKGNPLWCGDILQVAHERKNFRYRITSQAAPRQSPNRVAPRDTTAP